MDKKNLKPETIVAQGLGWLEEEHNGIIPGIFPSTTYERGVDGSYENGRVYSRDHNPNYDQPEQVLANLEGGEAALLFSSGMASAVSVFQALVPGDHVIAPKVMYWSLRNWLLTFATDAGLEVTLVDNGDPAALKEAVIPGRTKLLWLETPANPTWQMDDIALWAEVAKSCGAKLAVDNTVATPILTRPIEFGADIVMHSATKYLNGHSDVLAGALITAEKDAFWERICKVRNAGGAILGPFEAWLLMRGMRTLKIRVDAASNSAMEIARRFESHPNIEAVLYPGLENGPYYELAAKQMTGGFGGMLSLRIKGGEAAAMKVAANLKIIKRATSLGGVESLVEHRASIEGEGTPCPDDLLRFSIGIEATSDLISDIEQALEG